MDYELMMNGNVKIGQHAPDFNAEITKESGWYFFLIQVILPP